MLTGRTFQKIAVAGLLAGAAVYHCAVPALVARRIEAMLAARGFPAASVAVSGLGLDHLRLTGVSLGDGLELGAIEIDAGISVLWRPRIHQVTIRGAALSAAALDRLAPRATAPPAGDLPFDVVRIVDATLTLGGARLAVSGTVAPAGPSVDLTATSDAVALGPAVARDVRASIRDDAGALRACAAGRVGAAAVEICAALPRSLDALRTLRAVDARWTAAADGWQLQGRGALAWTGGVELRDGHAELTAPALRGRGATVRGAAIAADLTGRLSSLQLDVRGVAQAEQLELRDGAALTTARGLRVPFVAQLALVDGALRATPRRPVIATARSASIETLGPTSGQPPGGAVELAGPSLAAFDADRPIAIDARLAPPRTLRWSASAARIGGAELRAPSGTLIARRTLQWRAAEARWAGLRIREPSGTVELGASSRHTAAWTAITGPGPIEIGAGELRAHHSPAGWSLDAGRAQALGGELAVEPAAAAPDRPLDVVIRAHDLALHRVLGSLAPGHADGSGALDGELALRLTATGASLQRAMLHARPRGTVQLSDPAWRAQVSASATGFALHQRIAATLADFEYLRLAAVLHPAGSDPDLQITVQGRGKRIAQDLDLTINLHGLRSAARRPSFARTPRTQP
ncbi:MAG TPA: YdbH domain-containing protein [Kofleriaceae bacterium]|nr:YdbH domain-containing protein [Kofleriaceae bacterium]